MRASLTIREKTIGWWQALNPAIYLISILPGLAIFLLVPLGSSWSPILLATVGVVLIQHGINLMNDAMDWSRGADVEKYNSWVRYHDQSPSRARWHGLLALGLGVAVGVWVLFQAGQLSILAVALPLVVLGVGYNVGSKPFAYSAFSEWVTGVCYGPGVFGCLWLLSRGANPWVGAFGCMSFAALAVAVLLSHQPSQVLTDAMVGKRSFAVRFGVDTTLRATTLLFALSLAALDGAYTVALLPLPALAWVSSIALFTFFSRRRAWNPRVLLLATLGKLVFLEGLCLFGGFQ